MHCGCVRANLGPRSCLMILSLALSARGRKRLTLCIRMRETERWKKKNHRKWLHVRVAPSAWIRGLFFFFSYKLAHVGQNHSRFPLYLIPQLLSHYLWTRAIIHLTGLTLPALMRSQIDVYLLFLDCFSLCCQQCSTSPLPSPQKVPLHFSKSLIRSCEILTKVTVFFLFLITTYRCVDCRIAFYLWRIFFPTSLYFLFHKT